jgi:hypothetical protein
MTAHEEVVKYGIAVWQSDTAKTYRCPYCLKPLFSQYEGEESPTVTCHGPLADHVLRWKRVEG